MGNRHQLSREDIEEQLEIEQCKAAWLEEVNRLASQYGIFYKFEMDGECLAAFWNDDSPSIFLTDRASDRWLKKAWRDDLLNDDRGCQCLMNPR